MIKNLKLKNFQSHRDTSIELAPFTAIIGETNAGKSSIFRALRMLLFNPKDLGQSIINKNAKSCRVEVELESGAKIIREKSNKYNRYILNGNTYERIGNEIPKEVADELKSPLASFGEKSYELNLERQLEPPFLVLEPPSRVAGIIGYLSGLEAIDSIIQELNRDIKSKENEASKAKRELEETEKQLEELSWLDGALELAQALEEKNSKLKELQAQLERLNVLKQERERILQAERELLKKRPKISKKKVELLDSLLGKYERLEALQAEYEYNNDKLESETNNYNRLKTKVSEGERELLELLRKLGNCPLCGAVLDEERVKKILK